MGGHRIYRLAGKVLVTVAGDSFALLMSRIIWSSCAAICIEVAIQDRVFDIDPVSHSCPNYPKTKITLL
jgi:hypothetical protein